MQNSSKSKIPLGCFLLAFLGCASSQYAIHQREGERTALLVSPDRIVVECEDQYAGGGDRKDSFAFMIHVLDEEKTVLTVFQSNQTGSNDCFAKLKKTEFILKNSKQVYIAGIVNLNKPRKIEKTIYSFPKFGNFYGNGRGMSLSVIKGEDGTCVTAYEGYGRPCPWEPIFPANMIPF